MILLREVQERDLPALEKFSQIPGFINIPNDRELLREKVQRSIASFDGEYVEKKDTKYIFIAEDLTTGQALGTAMIAGQHGSPESPHFYFQLSKEERFSKTINTGFIHGTLELKSETDGPSEIGGLVLNPDYRNSDARIGRQISFVRFLFLGLNRARFKDKVLAELLPPLNHKGLSPLWEAIGRRFTNMDYWEADQLCQKNKEFLYSLFPSGKIYTTFFTADARNAIGQVGRETEPVLHMLTKIGFHYLNQVDPFDGGPHLWADVEQLLPLKRLGHYQYQGIVSAGSAPEGFEKTQGLLAKTDQKPGEFRATAVDAWVRKGAQPQEHGTLFLKAGQESAEIEKVLGIARDCSVAFMAYY